MRTDAGICVCDDGFELDSDGVRCRRCDVGQDSRRATLNDTGSAGCTLCAANFFRPDVQLPSSACTTCEEIPGVTCPFNSTIETLVLREGYWRLSPKTLQTWRCMESGSWSPCRGGSEAGINGDGFCREGYRGPRCELVSGSPMKPDSFAVVVLDYVHLT